MYQQPGGYQQSGYQQGGYGMVPGQMGNTSGMGEQSVVPPEIQGLNWGAFLLSWIWGLGNGVMIALLALIIPFFNIYLLIKGNELAWKAKRWDSVEAFQATQRKWMMAGLILIGVTLALVCISFFLIFVLAAASSSTT
jgi:hypothetical protein